MEFGLVLPSICCFLYRQRSAPERALIISRAWWIWAFVDVSIQTRVSFDVHVEGLAAGCLITLRSASEWIIASEGVKTHVI